MIDITTVTDTFNLTPEIPLTIEMPRKKTYFWVIFLILLIFAVGFLYHYLQTRDDNKVHKI